MNLLIGSTFPLSLIRRSVDISPSSIRILQTAAKSKTIHSFWGHSNTLAIANKTLGFDVSPKEERAILLLDKDNYPILNNIVFKACWVLSPDYKTSFRPKIGVEVSSEEIISWQVLHIIWR